WPEQLVCVPTGSVALVHFGMWHRATPNRSAGPRFMFKFEFGRMDEPRPSSVSDDDVPEGRHRAARTHLQRWMLGGAAGTAAANSQPGDTRAKIPQLVDLLSNAHEPARLDAAYALATAGTAAAVAAGEVMRGADGLTRRYAAYALTAMGEPAVETLQSLARDDDENVRISAVDALGDMGTPAAQAVGVLAESLRSQNPWLRRHAAEALGTLGSSAAPAVPALAAALTDEQPFVRMNAATALARIGQQAADAVPALVAALQDQDRYAH